MCTPCTPCTPDTEQEEEEIGPGTTLCTNQLNQATSSMLVVESCV